MTGIADRTCHARRPRRAALLARALLLAVAFAALTVAGGVPRVSAAPRIALSHFVVSPSPTPKIATTPSVTPSATPIPAGQPAFSCTASWCDWLDAQHWWLLGGPLLGIAVLVLLLAMRADMRTARAGSPAAKRAAAREARKAARKAARRAAWARLLGRKPPQPAVSPIWAGLPDESYSSGAMLPPAAPRQSATRRPSYTAARQPIRYDDRQ